MAIEIHFAELGLMQVDGTGQAYQRGRSSKTIKESLSFSTEHRIVADSDNSNTSDNPTIKTYLEREASDGYSVKVVNQSFVITEKTT